MGPEQLGRLRRPRSLKTHRGCEIRPQRSIARQKTARFKIPVQSTRLPPQKRSGTFGGVRPRGWAVPSRLSPPPILRMHHTPICTHFVTLSLVDVSHLGPAVASFTLNLPRSNHVDTNLPKRVPVPLERGVRAEPQTLSLAGFGPARKGWQGGPISTAAPHSHHHLSHFRFSPHVNPTRRLSKLEERNENGTCSCRLPFRSFERSFLSRQVFAIARTWIYESSRIK